jgi:uncharacterized membrane protein YhaH (DUF805 family)
MNIGKPVWQDLFNKNLFTARRNRLSYLLYLVVQFIVIGILYLIAMNLAPAGSSWQRAMAGDAGIYVIEAIVVIHFFGFAVMAQRFRDIGISGSWVLVVMIFSVMPMLGGAVSLLASIISLTQEGDTNKENKYGVSCLTNAVTN